MLEDGGGFTRYKCASVDVRLLTAHHVGTRAILPPETWFFARPLLPSCSFVRKAMGSLKSTGGLASRARRPHQWLLCQYCMVRLIHARLPPVAVLAGSLPRLALQDPNENRTVCVRRVALRLLRLRRAWLQDAWERQRKSCHPGQLHHTSPTHNTALRRTARFSRRTLDSPASKPSKKYQPAFQSQGSPKVDPKARNAPPLFPQTPLLCVMVSLICTSNTETAAAPTENSHPWTQCSGLSCLSSEMYGSACGIMHGIA
ncbi:hypothetical protein K458DRAFT_55938 [Lentithecium fluviatile CBS 122367]|uniref:Uncharacterized protein n=1 Tax=Lentithecium fluviatile CBS 122367 TaxID=1168545 RepID=A0A6G1IX47_9PLEO|nr:hypothetical protein K458DRAFT_55938 [Lentithecium fluviatile CBS 122367]